MTDDILKAFYMIDGEHILYDLSDGSLSDDDVGSVMGLPIRSAEALLNRIDGSETITIKKVHVLTNMIQEVKQ